MADFFNEPHRKGFNPDFDDSGIKDQKQKSAMIKLIKPNSPDSTTRKV